MLSIQRFMALASLAFALLLTSRAAEAGYAHYIYDASSGKVLASENAETLNHPASLTKMMTLYITFEALKARKIRWDDEIVMTPNAASKIPFKLGVKAGQTITVREAVYGMAIRSANDAAAAMGDHLGGSEERFGAIMTAKARQLGMRSTVFRNASGLPDEAQVTTARDMAVLAIALIRDYPKEYQIFSQRSFTFRGRTIKGHNNLMYRYPGMDGIKTGFVNASGYNLASAVTVNGRRLIGVVLGGKTARQRDNRMAELLDQTVPGGGGLPGVAVASRAQKRSAEGAVALATEMPIPSERREITVGVPAKAAATVTPYASTPVSPLAEIASANTQAGGADLWRIQISAAGSRSSASAVLEKAMPLLTDFGQLAPSVEGSYSGRQEVFRARLVGFAGREEATRACSVLKARSIDCFVVR
ncbi:D-alanyl-D-alanine carboxypeptidase (penicillin-binding protein 5/6) [Rhizobium sp. NFR07]|jgi:serine-type D-Ala-D-Ala carboxypeptidase (penicillin-binding protein 5/6)|uniref:D-alanyl-D-alanine carboxypeptidase family protein n=1 Tax=Rhizobium sp. NFR07 TaxID=1566262 RepID=UPI0008E4AFAC|nr:D-alanyl-D-alanine carboxypeptidase [Rhizobium sp. NFR07]SFB46213.1 D-alanyl-D-alanine carboxypeptidase (penicillin-binding protein 5/6) [Rhizobium sp. NFR07]